MKDFDIMAFNNRIASLEHRMDFVETQVQEIPKVAIALARIEGKLDERYEMTEKYRVEREERESQERQAAAEEQRHKDDITNRGKDRRVQWVVAGVALLGVIMGMLVPIFLNWLEK